MYSLGSAKVFTTLDCSRGFLQIQVAPDDVQKATFTCHRGLFEFTRLPFGLSNSPPSFQRLMDIVLGDAKFNFAMAYMDDVVVFSNSFEEHLTHLEIVLRRMREAGLTINPDKVQLAASRVNLLGFIVDNGTLKPNDDKLGAILNYPAPRDVKCLQRFLGMVGFYRQFIPGCAELAQPLNQLLRKNSRWIWGREHDAAFASLAKAIADTASLHLPDLNRHFVVQTDASDYGVGAVFLQEHDGQLRPVAFASRTLTPSERNYSVTEKEGLAVMFALKKFDLYLDGTTFVIQTDHAALTWIHRLREPAGRLARWALTLQRYSYTVEYRKGSSNKVADALSRAPQYSGREEETRPVGGEERGRGGRIPPCAGEKPPAIAGKRENGWEEGKQPEFVVAEGHSTRERRIVAWGKCLPEGETERRETSGVDAAGDESLPWEIVARDIAGPLPRSPRGNQYLLVVTDHFSKWVELYPLRKLVSERIWEKLLDTFLRFGTPKCLVSDNASYFTSKVFVDSCLALNIKHKRTTPYHPQANITERVNRNLKSMLIALTERHRDWDENIVEMGFAIRTTVNRSTGFTPAFLYLGKELPSPLENGLRHSDGGSGRPLSTYAAGLKSRLTDALHDPRENLDAARIEQAAQYDKSHRHLEYNVGDLVLRRVHPLCNAACGFAASLAPKWDGPYEVSTRVSRLTNRLTRPNATEESGPAHVTDLKVYYLRDQDGDGREAADEDGESPVSAGRQAQSGGRMKRGGRTNAFLERRRTPSTCRRPGTTPPSAGTGDDPSGAGARRGRPLPGGPPGQNGGANAPPSTRGGRPGSRRPDSRGRRPRSWPHDRASDAGSGQRQAGSADSASNSAATAQSGLGPPARGGPGSSRPLGPARFPSRGKEGSSPLVPLPCRAEPLAALLPPPPAEDTVMAELEEFLAGDRPPSADSGPPGSEP
ncbi:uncharacterized protein ISCGN_011642 [Ixodes scapularis]